MGAMAFCARGQYMGLRAAGSGEGQFVSGDNIQRISEDKFPTISIVAPCYNEEDCVEEFFRRADEACSSVSSSYEIVLVDDGSRDSTWELIESLCARSPHAVGIRLFRNHGHQLAASAGLAVSRGERVLLIDADLQDPPEALSDMMSLMDQGHDVVYGQRTVREGETWFKLLSAYSFYRILGILSPVSIPADTGDFRLMTRRVVDILNAMPERHRFLRGMVSWIGGRQKAYSYERRSRFAGSTGYPLKKMLRFAVDAITSFSIVPLRIATWVGAATSLAAFLIFAYAIYVKLTGLTVPGWTSSLASTALFSGVQLLVLGVIGEYLGRLVDQQKGRPLFIIDQISRGSDNCTDLESKPADSLKV